MDYSCRDIPMRLDINHQPLNFDIYLSQVIEIPKTSLDEPPYNFQVEIDALDRVENIIERNQQRSKAELSDQPVDPTIQSKQQNCEQSQSLSIIDEHLERRNIVDRVEGAIPPTCPIETPLTPIKGTLIPDKPCCTNSENVLDRPVLHQVNPKEFEDTHYNPFDHIELQTIDERRELDLVFRASYADHSREAFFPQSATKECSTNQEGTDTVTKT